MGVLDLVSERVPCFAWFKPPCGTWGATNPSTPHGRGGTQRIHITCRLGVLIPVSFYMENPTDFVCLHIPKLVLIELDNLLTYIVI